jgi:hypothetical protein
VSISIMVIHVTSSETNTDAATPKRAHPTVA